MKRASKKGKRNENNDIASKNGSSEPFNLLTAVKLRMEKGLSFKDISRILGVSPQSVQERLKRLGEAFNDPDRLQVLKDHEPIMIDAVRSLILERMSSVLGDSKTNISFSQLALGYGIMLDKVRLLRGQSTAGLQQITALIIAAHKPQGIESDREHSDKAIVVTSTSTSEGDTTMGTAHSPSLGD